MKLVCVTMFTLFIALPAHADDYVKGYFKKDGTYVEPHYKTDRNDTKIDNYSTKGNTNPYTGEKGYVDPYKNYNSYSNPYGSSRRY